MKRKIAAIMAADVVGYSRMISEDEEDTLRRLISYREVFADFVGRAGGRIFNTAGDAVLAEFPSAVDALRAAIEIQESIRTRNLGFPESRHMRFRIGMTIGDVVEREGDLLGDGVNIAARLEGLAEPGGICISRNVHEQVANKLSIAFRDIGPQSVKNIPTQIHAYQIPLLIPEPAAPVDSPQAPSPPARTRLSAILFGIVAFAAVLGLLALMFTARNRVAVTPIGGVALPAPAPDAGHAMAPAPAAPPVQTAPDTDAAAPSSDPGSSPAPLRPEEAAPATPQPSEAPAVSPPAPAEPLPPPEASTADAGTPAPGSGDDTLVEDTALLDEIREMLFEQNLDPGDPGTPAMAAAIRAFEDRAGLPQAEVPTMRLLRGLRDARSLKPWGAIAYAKEARTWGMSWGSPTRRIALAVARARCGSDQCVNQASFFGRNCGAFALSPRNWSITWRGSEAQARQAALDSCAQHGTTCRIVGAVCADGSGR